MACCDGITKHEYINGQFKSNLPVFSNRATVLKLCRKTLWKSLHGFKVHNITVSEQALHIYMDNQTFEHRKIIFSAFKLLDKEKDSLNGIKCINCMIKSSNISSNINPSESLFVNSILTKVDLSVEYSVYLFNCDFKSSRIQINKNTYLSDLELVSFSILFIFLRYKFKNFFLSLMK